MRATTTSAFSRRAAFAMVIVGVLSFASFLVLSAFANDLREPSVGGTHGHSKSAVGFAGIMALLQAEGRPVRMHRGAFSEMDASDGLLVLTPDVGSPIDSERLDLSWMDDLIVLPKWRATPDPLVKGWVQRAGLAAPEIVESVFDELTLKIEVQRATGTSPATLSSVDEYHVFEPLKTGPINQLQTMTGEDLQPIVVDQHGRMIIGLHDWGDEDDPGPFSYVLSDPDFLNTQGIASRDTAQAGIAIINLVAPPKAPVVFDVTMHGMERSRNLMKLLLVPPFLPAVLCLAFAGVLMGIHAAAGSGVKRAAGRELALGKKTLVENSALLFSLARREMGMGIRYAAMTRTLSAQQAGAQQGLNEVQQMEFLDAVARNTKQDTSFSSLAAEASSASTPSALLRAVSRLYRFRQEFGRERRRS